MTADLLFSWSGSIDRGRFWKGSAVVVALLLVSAILEAAAPQSLAMRIIALVPQGVGLYIMLVLAIKRCRAIGYSPWWALLLLVPIANLAWFVMIGFMDDQPADAESRPDAGEVEAPPVGTFEKAVGAVATLWLLLIFVWFGLAPPLRAVGTVFDGTTFLEQISGSFDLGYRVLAWMLLVLALGGTIGFVISERRTARSGRPNPHRERLAVWLGLPLSLLGILLAAVALVVFSAFPFVRSVELLRSTVEQALGGPLPTAVAVPAMLAALLTRSHGSASALAAPVVLAILYGAVAETSIARLMLALCPYFLALTVVGVIAGAVGGNLRRSYRFAAGFGVAAIMAVLLATGLTTPTEAVAMAVVPALLIAVFLQGSGTAFLRAASRGAVMLAAIATALVMSGLVATSLSVVAPQALTMILALADPFPTQALAWLIVVLAAVFSVMLTPVVFLALAPIYFALVMRAGYDPVLIGVPIVLATVAGLALAMVRDGVNAGGRPGRVTTRGADMGLAMAVLSAAALALLLPQIGQWALSVFAY